jgi:hypothetical protein
MFGFGHSSVVRHFAAAAAMAFSSSVLAAPVSVDGSIGSEWTGATVKSVAFNAGAPLGNFGTPSNENHNVAYDIYTRGDANYLYVGIQTLGSANDLDFANLYFDTNPGSGSDIGFEVTNQRAFKPGVAGYINYTVGSADIHYSLGSSLGSRILEFAVPYAVFTANTLGVSAMPLATDKIQLRLSQSFGYSVAGGASFGTDRLGTVTIPVVPLPAAAWTGLALMGTVATMQALRRKSA